MATEKREVELIIKANNLSSKQLKEVTAAIDTLSESLDKQVAAAKKGEAGLGELNSTYKKLEEAGKALIGQDALVKRFQEVSIAVQSAADKARTARAAFNALGSEQANYSKVTKEQDAQLRALSKSADAADKALARQQATLAALDVELKRVGIDTSNLATSESALVAAANRVAAAQRTATEAIDGYADAQRRRRSAEEDAGKNPFESSGRTTLSLLQRLKGEVLALAAAYVGLQGAIAAATGALDALKDEQQIQAKLLVLTNGDAQKAGDQYKYMREQAERLGAYFPEFAKAYTSFSIGVKEGGKVSDQNAKFIFESVTSLGRTLRLSNDDLNGVFKAMEQIASKGQVMSEELKGQIGERLPGAVALAAKEFGLSTEDFIKALEKGQVKAEQGLLALGRGAARLAAGGGTADIQKDILAQENLAKTRLFEFKKTIAESGFEEAYRGLLVKLNEFFSSDQGKKFAEDLGKAFAAVADALKFLLDNLESVKAVMEGIVGLYLAKQFFNMALGAAEFVKSLITMNAQLKTATGLTATLQKAFLVLSAFIAGWEIGKVLNDKFEIVRQLGVSLVTGFDKVWTYIKYGAEIAWEGIKDAFSNAGKVILDQMTTTFRSVLGIMQKGAQALGKTDLADSIGKAIDAMTYKQSQATKSRVAELKSSLQKELRQIEDIGFQMFQDASDAARKAGAGKGKATGAAATPESAPGSALKLSTGDADAKAAKKLLEEYKSLRAEVNAVMAQGMKKDKDDLQTILEGITKQYESLFDKIKTSGLAKKQVAELTADLDAAVAKLREEASQAYEKRQSDAVASIRNSLAEAEKKAGKSSGATLDERQKAIADSYADTYKKIADLDAAHQGSLKQQLDLLIAQLQELEKQKYAQDQIALSQKAVNDLVTARDDQIKTINDQVAAGLMTELQGREAIKAVIEQTQPGIEAAVASTRALADILRNELTPEQFAKIQAQLSLAAASAGKFKTELYSASQANKDLAAGITGALDESAKAWGEAVAGVKTYGEAIRETGKAFINFAADFLRKIAEMILQQIILNALSSAFGIPGGAGGGIAGFVGAMVKHDGGIVGDAGGRTRNISPAWFANAPRYHSGGMAGLKADEYPSVLQKNEEVLSASDPRNILNGGGAGSATPVVQDVKVVNTIDSGSFVSEGLSTPDGTRAVLNFIRANRSQVKNILG